MASSSYQAIVGQIEEIYPIQGADNIVNAIVSGYSIIVSKESQVGDIGILFPAGGQLSDEFLLVNNLYRKNPITGEKMGGFFDTDRRLRTLKLRGALSEAFFCPLERLSYCPQWDEVKHQFVVGYNFTHVGDTLVCEKYVNSRLRRFLEKQAANGNGAKSHRLLKIEALFPQHNETPHFRNVMANVMRRINQYDSVYITEKMHGTSGRTGYLNLPVYYSVQDRLRNAVSSAVVFARAMMFTYLSRYWQGANAFIPDTTQVKALPATGTIVLGGTRRTILSEGAEGEKGMDYRQHINATLGAALKEAYGPGYTLYYEIVGYTRNDGTGTSIMSTHSMNKEAKKAFPDVQLPERIVYHYGHVSDYGVYVYRVTYTHPETGAIQELSFSECITFVRRLNETAVFADDPFTLDMVRTLDLLENPASYSDTAAGILLSDLKRELDACNDSIGNGYPGEGVCVRFERRTPDGTLHQETYKWKAALFSMLEEIAVHELSEPDTEDAS